MRWEGLLARWQAPEGPQTKNGRARGQALGLSFWAACWLTLAQCLPFLGPFLRCKMKELNYIISSGSSNFQSL